MAVDARLPVSRVALAVAPLTAHAAKAQARLEERRAKYVVCGSFPFFRRLLRALIVFVAFFFHVQVGVHDNRAGRCVEVLRPERGAFAHSCWLRGLVMGPAKRR